MQSDQILQVSCMCEVDGGRKLRLGRALALASEVGLRPVGDSHERPICSTRAEKLVETVAAHLLNADGVAIGIGSLSSGLTRGRCILLR